MQKSKQEVTKVVYLVKKGVNSTKSISHLKQTETPPREITLTSKQHYSQELACWAGRKCFAIFHSYFTQKIGCDISCILSPIEIPCINC